MAIVIVDHKLTKDDVERAREEYKNFIKITVDVEKHIVLIGGEYYSDSEKILVSDYGSKRSDIEGRGYDCNSKNLTFDALINIKPKVNESSEILDLKVRDLFRQIVEKKLKGINVFL